MFLCSDLKFQTKGLEHIQASVAMVQRPVALTPVVTVVQEDTASKLKCIRKLGNVERLVYSVRNIKDLCDSLRVLI